MLEKLKKESGRVEHTATAPEGLNSGSLWRLLFLPEHWGRVWGVLEQVRTADKEVQMTTACNV